MVRESFLKELFIKREFEAWLVFWLMLLSTALISFIILAWRIIIKIS